jgi:hypothetical protein
MDTLKIQDLEQQGDAPVAIDEGSRVKLGDDWPKCLGCGAEIRFNDEAMEVITFRRMCEDRQSIFSCPVCHCRHAIFAEGGVPMTSTPDCVSVHAPEGGYALARTLEQARSRMHA